MGIGRKRALEIIEELCPQVEWHLAKLASRLNHPSSHHRGVEVQAFLGRMRRSLPEVGHQTGELWAERIEAWQKRTGNFR